MTELMPITVSIVEDAPGVREGLVRLLNSASGFGCVASYPDAESALTGIPGAPPDVVLMDIQLPRMSGIACTASLKKLLPSVPVMMLTVYEDTDAIFNALKAGASGYLLKRTASTRLLEAIHDVHNGGSPMTPQLARRVVQFFTKPAETSSPVASLTAGEKEFLNQLANGYAYKEIADRMKISIDTVRSYVRTVYEKLHVHSRTEAVVKFLRG